MVNDVLLIPRTVFMPYAPYAPTAPAKLRMAAPADRVIEEQTRELTPTRPREATSPETKLNETLDKCLEAMANLNNRLTILENRAPTIVAPIAPPAVCPPAGPDCPPAIPDCPPGRRIIFSRLHPNLCPTPAPAVKCPPPPEYRP
jgi:hypothetical protein